MNGPAAAAVSLALAVAACAACGPREGGEAGTVRFWALGREGEVVASLMPEFERRNPGIRVRVEQIPWTAAHEKLLTAFVGGATPDLAQVGNTWIPELAALGAIEPLDARVAAAPTMDEADQFAGIWETNTIDGTVYGVPWYVDTRVLFYRRDLLARAGYPDPPRTWDAWRDAMRAVEREPGTRFGALLPTDEWAQPVLFALQENAEILRDGGRYGDFLDPRFREGFAFYVGLFRDGLAPVASNATIGNLYQQFAEGYFATYVTGPWNLGEFRRRLRPEERERWATAPMPAPDAADGYPGASLALGASLVVFRSSRRPDAAWRVIEYLAEPATQARFYELTGDLPARRSAWDASSLAGDRRADAFREQLERLRSTPRVPEWEQIATKIAEHAERAIRGTTDVDGALRDLQADVDRILEKRRSLLDRARSGSSR